MKPIVNILAPLEQTTTAYMAARNTPGLTLAITDRAETLHVATYGYADLTARQPVTPEMLFEIGSIGKSFTALVLMQLAEAGQIDLHAPISDYLPWFAITSQFEPITIHHLLRARELRLNRRRQSAACYLLRRGVLSPK